MLHTLPELWSYFNCFWEGNDDSQLLFLANSLLLVILFYFFPLNDIDGVYDLNTELFLYIKIAKLQSLHKPVRFIDS